MKLLLIDDDAVWARSLLSFFSLIEGWEVVLKMTPAAAIAELESAPKEYDLILLDIMMAPDETVDEDASNMGQDTGLLLLDRISQLTKETVPVVILSARQDIARRDYEGRARLYLQKTHTASEIVELIREVCNE